MSCVSPSGPDEARPDDSLHGPHGSHEEPLIQPPREFDHGSRLGVGDVGNESPIDVAASVDDRLGFLPHIPDVNNHLLLPPAEFLALLEDNNEIKYEPGVICNNFTPLHAVNCKDRPEDLVKMQQVLTDDPESLTRLQVASCGFAVETLPLHDAIRACHSNCVRFLLKSGANPDVLDETCGYTPLGFAILLTYEINEEIVEILLDHGASMKLENHYYSKTSYFEDTIFKNFPKLVNSFLNRGCEIEDLIVNEKGEFQQRRNSGPPILYSLWKQQTSIFKTLLLKGAAFKFVDRNGLRVSLPLEIVEYYKTIDRALEAFRLYHEFGGSLREELPYVYDTVQKDPSKYALNVNIDSLQKELEEIIGKPRTLASLCRIKIRQIIGRKDCWEKVHLLPLPDQVIQFLQFSDLPATDAPHEDLIQ